MLEATRRRALDPAVISGDMIRVLRAAMRQ